MKKITQLLLLSGIFLVSGNCSKPGTRAIVDRNCSGTYLQMNEYYFQVCNAGWLEGYETGDQVHVTFRETGGCKDTDGPICFIAVEYDASIELLSVH